MKSFSEFQILGNVGNIDKVTYEGGQLMKISVAVNESYKKGDGTITNTHWFNCVAFGEKLTRYIESYIKKGQRVLINGQLKTQSWTKDDETRYDTLFRINEIINLSKPKAKRGRKKSNA